MLNTRYRDRLAALFSDFEHLAANPASATAEVLHKLDELRTRLFDLEAQFVEAEKNAATERKNVPPPLVEVETRNEPPRPSGPILYEEERMGFVCSGDKVEPIRELHSPEAPNTHAFIAPLTVQGQTIGKMQVDLSDKHPLRAEESNLVDTVAQQASLQIQALRLLAATERARSEAESATRRFIHENWDSYLDAINHSERIGYAYDQAAVTLFLEDPLNDGGIQETVKVAEEQVGTLYVKPNPTRPLTQQDNAMVATVAKEIAKQVENIRLLADASRARAEAEEATRRMTRESWQTYATEEDEAPLGFIYDSNQVTPANGTSLFKDAYLVQPLMVNGEPIGRLAVAGGTDLRSDAASLAASVAAQASTHLETLRLNDELRKRAAELQELDRLKSTFLANMSHELRTPLNSILGFADVILEELDGPLTENMSNDLQLIQKNGQHLLHLINDVLDMAKISAGRMNMSLERFKIQEMFEDVINITSPMAGGKALLLCVEDDSDKEVEVNADRTRIRQVMINVANNAIKFAENSEIRFRAVRQGENILIAVRDKGLGIPPDKLEAIFQEFTQVDSSTTRKAGGTGLGLPISRKLVEMHGGRMWAESTGVPGEGATLYVELPIEAKLAEPVEKQEK